MLEGLFKDSSSSNQMQYAKFLDGMAPIFTQFGNNIYASDIVQICIDRIAVECSKLMPRHIVTDNNNMQTVPKDSINRLFKYGPNELMTTKDFIEKIIWLLFLNYNAFIYPKYNLILNSNGGYDRYYTGFYPLNPTQVTFLEDDSGTLYVELTFLAGRKYTIPYSRIIHLRKKFSMNDIMGGGLNGCPDNEALLKVLAVNDTIMQGIGKAIKSSLNVKGILKLNTMMNDEHQSAEITRFEESMSNGTSGILPIDITGEYFPVTIDPKVIDKDTMEFIQHKVLDWYSVSMPIFNGNANDDEHESFYQAAIEPIVIGLDQAFSKTIFTDRQLDVGHEIIFYQKDLSYLSTSKKLELLKTTGEQGLLTDDQKLGILGYPPIPDGSGNIRRVSLNYIDVKLVNQYQLKNNSGGKNNGAQ